MNILGVIPARGGSKGISRKNIVNLNGKPLISYMIEAAKKSHFINRLIVSTDDEEIASVAKRYGAEVPFVRPSELAGDEVSSIFVYKHALQAMDKLGWRADIVVSMQPTSPLMATEVIDVAVQKLLDTDCDCVLTMRKVVEEHPYRIYSMDGDRVVFFKGCTVEDIKQRQDRPLAFKFNGAICVRKRSLLDEWNQKDLGWGEDRRGVLMSQECSIDVNEQLDLLICESILQSKNR